MQEKPVDTFKSRRNNYKESSKKFLRGDEIKQKSLHEYFLKYGHHGLEEDFSISLTDRTDLSDHDRRQYH